MLLTDEHCLQYYTSRDTKNQFVSHIRNTTQKESCFRFPLAGSDCIDIRNRMHYNIYTVTHVVCTSMAAVALLSSLQPSFSCLK